MLFGGTEIVELFFRRFVAGIRPVCESFFENGIFIFERLRIVCPSFISGSIKEVRII
jgi:hypothetical protein